MLFCRMAAQSKVVQIVQERPSLTFAFAAGSLFTAYYLWAVVKVSFKISLFFWFYTCGQWLKWILKSVWFFNILILYLWAVVKVSFKISMVFFILYLWAVVKVSVKISLFWGFYTCGQWLKWVLKSVCFFIFFILYLWAVVKVSVKISLFFFFYSIPVGSG